jgi:hypothetical protein
MEPFVVGAAGHRFLADMSKVRQGVQAAARHIQDSFPSSQMVVLSSLAEGADRVITRSFLRLPGVALWALLPLQREDYLADFPSPASRREFLSLLEEANRVIEMPGCENREQAYLTAGCAIVEQCSCLVTIWDGQPAQGLAGTGEVVARARERKLPLAWVHAGNRLPGTNTPTSLGREQGSVTYERFPN